MIADRPVSANKLHVTELTFTCVHEDTVGRPTILISVGGAAATCKQEDEGMVGGCDDPALPLAAVDVVDILLSAVLASTDECVAR